MDFTIDKYADLCEAVSGSRYSSVTLAEYLGAEIEPGNRRFLILRHDIDRTPERALDTALVEHQFGLKATYYFRFQKSTFVPALMDKINSLGHEIGYHYETIDKCKGDMESAIRLFQRELSDFRNRYEVKTVCAHGNPLTRFNNSHIWQNIKLSDFGLLGEAFLALDFTRFAYFSDSGRTWLNDKSQKMPGKDSVKTAFDHFKPQNTDDVINLVRGGDIPNICILTHPERWCKDISSFTIRYLIDLVFSLGKTAITVYRGVK